jgi:hypothetical protein
MMYTCAQHGRQRTAAQRRKISIISICKTLATVAYSQTTPVYDTKPA